MDLKEFVAESLKQIVDGVKEAQEHAVKAGGKIAPRLNKKGTAQDLCLLLMVAANSRI